MSTRQTEFGVSTSRGAKPFLKWVGGKQQLLSQYEPYFPTSYQRYLEPFVGGGAVFFHLSATRRLPENVHLFDNNEDLVNTYCIIRDDIQSLMAVLAEHQARHTTEYYYHIRSLDRHNRKLSKVESAARFIYLNRTGYNGLYRVNSKNQFNVPIGSYKNPQVLYENVLLAANAALQGVCVEVSDFRDGLSIAQAGDFFYFDPPYDPVSKTSSFTGYTAGSFRDGDQKDLADVFEKLTEKGCLCMLSNSYTPFILDLYKQFNIKVVDARRAVNSNSTGRGTVREVLVLNY